MSDYFDRLTSRTEPPLTSDEQPAEQPTVNSDDVTVSPADTNKYTNKQLKATTQELLKYGLLEAERKPNLYQVAVGQTRTINQILEPLDLRLQVDEIRGLAFLMVSDQLFAEDGEHDDEWSHPLVRRQRLSMEQSLLIAILRQHYIAHEQEAGIGVGNASVELEELLPQLQLYLGDTGSDDRDQKRLRALLDNLKTHGIVSDVDANDQVVIRPIITHLANPENLQNLLHHFRKLAGQPSDSNGGDA